MDPSASLEIKKEQNSRSIHVGNVDYGVTEKQLVELFKDCGTILRATIPKNAYNGRPMGYANIEFDTQTAVANALTLTGRELNGRRIMVQRKVITPKRQQQDFWGYM